MKSKLCSGLVVLCIAVLSATAAHADEPDAVVVEETVSETGEPADPVTAQPESELALQRVQRAQRDRQKGTGLMTAAFVAQGISLGVTFASIFASNVSWPFSWVPVVSQNSIVVSVHRSGAGGKLSNLDRRGCNMAGNRTVPNDGHRARLSFGTGRVSEAEPRSNNT